MWIIFGRWFDSDIMKVYHNDMNAKHRKTLAALFASPIPRNIVFRDVAVLLAALGCMARQREGSRVDFIHGPHTLHLHEPHPGKEIKPYQVKDVRMFLTKIGVAP